LNYYGDNSTYIISYKLNSLQSDEIVQTLIFMI